MTDEGKSVATVFSETFNDSVRLAFVITRSEQNPGAFEVQFWNRDESETLPLCSGLVNWEGMNKLAMSIMENAPGSIFVPAYTPADITSFIETNESLPGYRHHNT